MKGRIHLTWTPRHVRRLLAFYHAPQRYAHASWPETVLAALAAMTDCPDPPLPPEAPILACLDKRRIARFVAVLDCILADAADAADAADPALRAGERALVRASAALLYPPAGVSGVSGVSGAAGLSVRTGAGYLSRYYATQAPAIAVRLRLLLPYDGAPFMCPPDTRCARAEQRFLERTWNWGARQCFW
ncbi:MAG: hypothetical protein ACRYHA_34560 [Janthinobacterium lividum]